MRCSPVGRRRARAPRGTIAAIPGDGQPRRRRSPDSRSFAACPGDFGRRASGPDPGGAGAGMFSRGPRRVRRGRNALPRNPRRWSPARRTGPRRGAAAARVIAAAERPKASGWRPVRIDCGGVPPRFVGGTRVPRAAVTRARRNICKLSRPVLTLAASSISAG